MLSIVGAGFGRTGTTSLKAALDSLGYGPCYHMSEVFAHPEHIEVWNDAGAGKPVDWDALFEGYSAAIDYPAAHFWQELMTHYPESKVILTVRDTEDWYRSITNTIFRMIDVEMPEAPEFAQRQRAMARKLVVDQYLGGNATDPEHVKKSFEANNQRVIDTVPADRLLVFQVSDGWRPLCDFLGCEIPDEDFPHRNTTQDFLKFADALIDDGDATGIP